MSLSLNPSVNWLLVFIPVSVALEYAHVPPPVLFFSAALAIVPIASLIVHSTEQLATRTGDAIGGLLNATFGNAPELIIALVALRAGFFDMVRASIIGSILANRCSRPASRSSWAACGITPRNTMPARRGCTAR